MSCLYDIYIYIYMYIYIYIPYHPSRQARCLAVGLARKGAPSPATAWRARRYGPRGVLLGVVTTITITIATTIIMISITINDN